MSEELPTMKVTASIDGIRLNAARCYRDAHQAIETMLEEMDGAYSYLTDDVKEAMNDLNFAICSFFCVYMPEVKDFSNLGDEMEKLMPEEFDLEEE